MSIYEIEGGKALASNPGFPFRISSHSFGAKLAKPYEHVHKHMYTRGV